MHKLWGAVSASVVVAMAPAAWAQGAGGEVAFVRGQAQGAIAPASNWQNLAVRASLASGDAIKTGADGVASLRLGQGGSLSLGPSSVLRLQEHQGQLGGRLLMGRARLQGPSAGESILLAGSLRLLAGPGVDAMVEKVGAAWRVVGLQGAVGVVEGANDAVFLEGGQAATFVAGSAPQVASVAGEVGAIRASFASEAPSSPRPSSPQAMGAMRPVDADRLWAAGLSLMVPGAGQLYAGELPRGLTYMGLNFALLGAGAYGKWTHQALWSSVATGGLVGLNVISPLDAWFLTPEKK